MGMPKILEVEMKISQKGIDLVKHFEGFRDKAYICPAGVLTIGYGHTKNVTKGMVISEKEAEDLLKGDLEHSENVVNKLVEVEITQGMFDALVSFVFNLGEGNFGSSTLLKKLNSKDYYGASEEFQKWRLAGGKVMQGLVKRRSAERDLFNSYPKIV